MAFFGITALGPPNTFKSSLATALGVTVFSNEEYQAAFKKFDKDGNGFINADEVADLLFHVYGFPPLDKEVEMFMEAFDLNNDGKISYDEFTSVLDTLRDRCNNAPNKAKEYQSFGKLTVDRFKHTRMAHEVQDKYKMPVTHNQKFGYQLKEPLVIDVVTDHRIKQCDETKYAAEMVRTGFI